MNGSLSLSQIVAVSVCLVGGGDVHVVFFFFCGKEYCEVDADHLCFVLLANGHEVFSFTRTHSFSLSFIHTLPSIHSATE